jgi:hypothetical protein
VECTVSCGRDESSCPRRGVRIAYNEWGNAQVWVGGADPRNMHEFVVKCLDLRVLGRTPVSSSRNTLGRCERAEPLPEYLKYFFLCLTYNEMQKRRKRELEKGTQERPVGLLGEAEEK